MNPHTLLDMGQTFALVFFAGRLTQTVREHDRRLVVLEKAKAAADRDLGKLEGKVGIS